MSSRLWLLLAFVLLGLAAAGVFYMEDSVDVSQKQEQNYFEKVSVRSVPITTQAGTLRTFAEVKPRWSAMLKAHVSGEVVSISERAMAGEHMTQGELLIQIEDSAYIARLAMTKKSLADARLVLLQEEKKAKQAERDWQRSGLKTKPSALALNKPQLDVARKAVEVAKANITAAEKESTYTQVSAPFSGLVTERFVSIGQTLSAGDNLVQVLDNTSLDIAVLLSQQQWQNLSEDWQQQTVAVKNDHDTVIAQAVIKRGGGFLDPKTRQYKIFLEIINNDSNQVLTGEFVHIELPGKTVANTLRVPESAFTREGFVWYVDKNNRLRYFQSRILFYQANELIITAPVEHPAKTLNIITAPLASFIAGNEVSPVMKEQ